MPFYHLAQVCKNGHMINDRADTDPSYNKRFCPRCGAETITTCPSCNAKIHGDYEIEGVAFVGCFTSADPYCYNCGEPYPWTKSALLAAAALIYEEEALTDEQKQRTIDSLPDIITETPNTNLASVRFKKCLVSVGKFTADGLRQFAIDFGCELAKKTIGL